MQGAGLYGSVGGAQQGGPQGTYYGTETRDGATIDKYMVQEAQQVPFKQITYTMQEVQQPRNFMESVTKSIQVPTQAWSHCSSVRHAAQGL